MRSSVGWKGANHIGPAVVFLNRFYSPDHAATAQMLSDLAVGLSRKGWTVTVIASRARYDGQQSYTPREDICDGVHVYRLPSTNFGRDRLLGRMLDYLSFTALAFWRVLRIPRPMVIVAMSDPPFIVLIAIIAARLRNARVCYWVQDVYPLIAARIGVLSESGLAFKGLNWLARRLHSHCDLVVALGQHMRDNLLRTGAAAGRTICIHNWADDQAIRPVPRDQNPFVEVNGLRDKFVVLYSGNAGRGHTFQALCEVMARKKNDARTVFLFIGSGKRAAEIRAYATARALSNVVFLDYLPRDELRYSLSAADVSMVTEDSALAGLLVPSKTYGILASGRPIIFVGSAKSDVAAIIRETGCGYVVDQNNPDLLESVIQDLARNPALAAAMGKAGREALDSRYSLSIAVEKWDASLRSIIS